MVFVQKSIGLVKMDKPVTINDFFISTEATFELCPEIQNISPHFTSFKRNGKVNSEYWYFENYLYRRSDHWGQVIKCKWHLKGLRAPFIRQIQTQRITARVRWKDMKHIT